LSSRVSTRFVLIAVAAVALAGCSSSVFDRDSYSQLFAKKMDLFATPEWARATSGNNNIQLGPRGPVPPEDLVSADGRCAPPVETAPAAQAAAAPASTAQAQAQEPTEEKTASIGDRRVGSVAGDLAGAPMPQGPRPKAATTGSAPPPDRLEPEGSAGAMPTGSALLGGVALGMTECQVVRRAGTPNNISVGDQTGVRRVVLSYLGGNWPGIYRFQSGRLKEVDAVPQAEQPVAKTKTKTKNKKKAKKKAPQESTNRTGEHYYVQ
jgi:hypothetical protein